MKLEDTARENYKWKLTVEVESELESLFRALGPLQDLLGPVHPEESVHLALSHELDLEFKCKPRMSEILVGALYLSVYKPKRKSPLYHFGHFFGKFLLFFCYITHS